MINNSLLLCTAGGGNSFWPSSYIVTPSGHKIGRHISDMGTVMEFTDNKLRMVIVLDAIYRTHLAWGPNSDSPLKNYKPENSSFCLSESMTDAQLNSFLPFQDAGTSKSNTDALNSSKYPAAYFCRQIKVNGVGCDLPNFNTLARIWINRVSLDSIDPTIAQAPNYTLADWFFVQNESYQMVSSSTEYNEYSQWQIVTNGCTYPGHAWYKQLKLGVIPVLELAE